MWAILPRCKMRVGDFLRPYICCAYQCYRWLWQNPESVHLYTGMLSKDDRYIDCKWSPLGQGLVRRAGVLQASSCFLALYRRTSTNSYMQTITEWRSLVSLTMWGALMVAWYPVDKGENRNANMIALGSLIVCHFNSRVYNVQLDSHVSAMPSDELHSYSVWY